MSAVEEQLAWEAEQRPRVALVAVAAGLCTIAGSVLLTILLSDLPRERDGFISLTEALGARLGGAAPAEPSLLVRQAAFFTDNVVALSLATVLTALGAALSALTLAFLFKANHARDPKIGRLPIIMTVIGGVSLPIGHLAGNLSRWIGSSGVEEGAPAGEARDVLGSSFVVFGQFFELIGAFGLGVGFALVALNAMRAGLLTRLLGILGIFVGVLVIFQVDQPQLVRTVWLIAVGLVVIGGRGRAGLLPAWQTGRAEPWPSQQQLREQRDAAGGRRPVPQPEPAADAEPASEGAVSVAGQPRRKRKRRK